MVAAAQQGVRFMSTWMRSTRRPIAEASADMPSLDFELVSLDSARKALQQPPAGVPEAEVMTEADWKRRRRELTEAQRRPTEAAMRWFLSLPQDVRPVELLKRYPRIANRLAECWSDARATSHNLDELVLDRRGGRRGFPPQVAQELVLLRETWLRKLRRQ
jgi:hypothetical protein